MAIWVASFIILGSTIGIVFASIFACSPMSMNWNIRVTEGTCIKQPELYFASAAMNIFSDLYLFCLPLPMVIMVPVSARQKIGLVLLFLFSSM